MPCALPLFLPHRANWRYSLSANVVCLMLMPAPSHTEHVMPFARHALALFGSGMLPLRQLAAGTLSLLLTRVVDFKETNPQLVAEVSAWLLSSGSSLTDHLAADHTKLEAIEASQDKRGGGLAAMQARYLNMTHDELILKVVAVSTDRTKRWPEGGHADLQPQAVRTGLFEVQHARLVALLATVAPQETLQALQPSLEQAARNASSQQVVAYTSEKVVQAAAAEATAGLLAAGAPWVSGAGTGSGGGAFAV
ncbi:hypothetical protein DUNSADRAFT_13106 [Dunaliella salina]|uniref:Uncharacterized protein n=1 Tax=Dunaliella salina TaxID=3046 RepID=A0ABQ7GA34_DUNSA|nr:hypothetical protein DUNSADRAFT_13106 [Dunaliella salina]|eukprot:KAF5831466.1 hypothetical protein DUNSADRAFT_13106 [Dunaliella salina]